MSATTGHQDPPALDPVGAILAFALPGLGHWYQGDHRRAVLLGAGILGLFFGGLLIGGIDAVDSRHDRLWFVGQVLVGPVALGTDYLHQHRFKGIDPETHQARSPLPNEVKGPDGYLAPAPAGEGPPISKSLGKMNEIGMLYCTIAGMLNLIVIIDAAFPSRRRGGSA